MKHVNEQPPKQDCIENIYENTFKSPKGMFNKAMENSEYHELGEFNQRSLYDKLEWDVANNTLKKLIRFLLDQLIVWKYLYITTIFKYSNIRVFGGIFFFFCFLFYLHVRQKKERIIFVCVWPSSHIVNQSCGLNVHVDVLNILIKGTYNYCMVFYKTLFSNKRFLLKTNWIWVHLAQW